MTTTVRDLLLRQQKVLLTKLGSNAAHDHPGDIGDATELDWKGVLRDFLPQRYEIAKAKVLDGYDEISEQIDLIIFDRQYCPLWLKGEGTSHYVPAESVYAAFEVKQNLSKAHLEAASDKIESVRRLHRTSAPVVHAGGRINAPKEPFPIIGGILTTRSTWSPPLGHPFESALLAEPPARWVDLGCALRDGGFDVDRPAGRKPMIHCSSADASLIFFLLRLFVRLQALGTVPVIDLGLYGSRLEA